MLRKRSPLQTLTLMMNPYIILQASYLNVSSGSITTPYLTVAKDLTVSGHITSSYPLTLKGNTKKRQNLTSATIICFNITRISIGAEVAINSNTINGVNALAASGKQTNNITFATMIPIKKMTASSQW